MRRGRVGQLRRKISQRYLERFSKKLSLLRQSNQLSELQGYIHTIQQWLQKSRWGLAWLHDESQLPSIAIYSSLSSFGCIPLSATQRYQRATYPVQVSDIGQIAEEDKVDMSLPSTPSQPNFGSVSALTSIPQWSHMAHTSILDSVIDPSLFTPTKWGSILQKSLASSSFGSFLIDSAKITLFLHFFLRGQLISDSLTG